MPIKIDCPACKGDGYIVPDPNDYAEDCPLCGRIGKITVYTQEEVNKKIGYVEDLYTPEEINKAIQDTKEACAKICDDFQKYYVYTDAPKECAKAIRNRK